MGGVETRRVAHARMTNGWDPEAATVEENVVKKNDPPVEHVIGAGRPQGQALACGRRDGPTPVAGQRDCDNEAGKEDRLDLPVAHGAQRG